MDQSQLREMLPPKEENPLLKKKPLNLGTRFYRLPKLEEQIELESVLHEHQVTLILFAAEWCNVCRPFVSLLKSYYEEINLEEKKLEVILVSMDRSKKDYEGFAKEMPWLSIAHADERVSGLKQFYDIRSIPALLLVDARGEEVKRNCRQDVYQLGEDAAFEEWLNLKAKQDKGYDV